MEGTVALVGSGEYLPSMRPLERSLLENRPPRFVQIATAAVPDGEERVAYWHDLGRTQAESLDVTCVIATVSNRDEANDPQRAELVRSAGLIYLSGGHPGFLADVLRDTLLWESIVTEWRSGASLAGCSAGAMAMCSWVPSLRHPFDSGVRGLGLFPSLRVIPHFDAFYQRVPSIVDRFIHGKDESVSLIGIDEETAIVGGPHTWKVQGRGSAWRLDGERVELPSGSVLTL
jgi:cyanophycinase